MCEGTATILSVISLLIYATEYVLYVFASKDASPKMTPLTIGFVLVFVHIALVLALVKIKRAKWIFGVALGLASLMAVAYVALYLLISEASVCLFGECVFAYSGVMVKYNSSTLVVLAVLSVSPYIATTVLLILNARKGRVATLESEGVKYTPLEPSGF